MQDEKKLLKCKVNNQKTEMELGIQISVKIVTNHSEVNDKFNLLVSIAEYLFPEAKVIDNDKHKFN